MRDIDIQRAIEVLRHPTMYVHYSEMNGFRVDEDIYKACATAIDCMKKQLPKAPEYKVHEKYPTLGKNYYCSCGVMFVDFERNGTNYCGNCGQKLKEAQNG